jgi:uncharacterized membrane protein (DUF106 family)
MNKYLGCFFGIIVVLIIGSIVETLDEALYSFFSILFSNPIVVGVLIVVIIWLLYKNAKL